MKNKIIYAFVGLTILVGSISFFAGTKYNQSKTSSLNGFGNVYPGQQNRMIQGGIRGGRIGQNLIIGEIISKDDKSITIKLKDGGSKIVFLSDKTAISKIDSGIMTDLKIGEQITTNGSANSDGSLTAQSIQIRTQSAPTN